MNQKPVALFVIATNKYLQFLNPLLKSVEEHFLKEIPVDVIVFTNHNEEELVGCEHNLKRVAIKVHKVVHKPWPMMTLERYQMFDDLFQTAKQDLAEVYSHVFYCDVDMLFVADVGKEILLDEGEEGLIATAHHGFLFKPRETFTFETNPLSAAYIPPEQNVLYYYAGGFQGGTTSVFAKACFELSTRIKMDLDNEIVAVWHDESHWNRLCFEQTPAKILSPSYCYHETRLQEPWPFKPKLLALTKKHSEVRD